MNTIAFAVPVVRGKERKLRELGRLLQDDHRAEAEQLRREMGVDREQAFAQSTPDGDLSIVVWDTDDPRAALRTARTSPSEHARWFRDRLDEIHGPGFSSQELPVPVLGADWHDDSWSFGRHEEAAVCFPVKPGRSDDALSFMRTIAGERREEFVRTRRELGIVRQLFFVQQTPHGDFSIMYGEGERPGWFPNAFHQTFTSSDPFLSWWRGRVAEFADVSLDGEPTPPRVEKILDLTVRVPARA